MTAYYNENDPYAAEWLRNLIAAGHIAAGDVDERSIKEVQPDDIKNYTQCHFFAGIGVWSHALRRAGCPDDQPVWTGSCPCQPFSNAGQQKGFDDERHLWPVWFNLIRECRPPIVIGEQVASALQWLDLVSSDMEGEGYAFGASDLCAAGFDGAHIRQRLYFCGIEGMAHASGEGRGQAGRYRAGHLQADGAGARDRDSDGGAADRLANAERERVRDKGCQQNVGAQSRAEGFGAQRERLRDDARNDGDGRIDGSVTGGSSAPMLGRTPVDWLFCRDGKWRPVEPSTFPLADAPPARVGRLRAYGNALDAETAAQFCGAVMDVVG